MEYTDLIKRRRAVNFFDESVGITMAEIREIYEDAKLAPSSFNLQPLKVVVVTSSTMKEKLKNVANNQPKITEASAILVLFGNLKQYLEADDIFEDRVKKGYMTKEQLPIYREVARQLYEKNEEAFVSRNIGIFAMNFMLAALDKGWDTHPMDGFDVEGVINLFNLDSKYYPVLLIAIGKRDTKTELLPRCKRRDFDEIFVEM